MSLNDFVDIAQKVAGTPPDHTPAVDRTEQVQVGLGFAKRQAEKHEKPPVEPAIPPMGAYPVPS